MILCFFNRRHSYTSNIQRKSCPPDDAHAPHVPGTSHLAVGLERCRSMGRDTYAPKAGKRDRKCHFHLQRTRSSKPPVAVSVSHVIAVLFWMLKLLRMIMYDAIDAPRKGSKWNRWSHSRSSLVLGRVCQANWWSEGPSTAKEVASHHLTMVLYKDRDYGLLFFEPEIVHLEQSNRHC